MHALIDGERHIVAKVVETEFVVRAIRDIGSVRLFARFRIHSRYHHANTHVEKRIELAHPFRVAFREIIIHRHDVYAGTGQCIQVDRQRGDERLALTGAHFGYLALMEHHPAEHLNIEVAHPEHPLARLADNCECFRQQIIYRLAAREPFAELSRFQRQLFVGQFRELVLQHVDRADFLAQLLQKPVVTATEY